MRACMHAFVAGAIGGVGVFLLLLLFLLLCSWMLASPAANLLVLVLLWQQATTASETGLTVFFPRYACFLHKAKTTTSPSTSQSIVCFARLTLTTLAVSVPRRRVSPPRYPAWLGGWLATCRWVGRGASHTSHRSLSTPDSVHLP